MKWLVPNPNLTGTPHAVAVVVSKAASELLTLLGDGQELSAMLRLLRQAKECGVIQALEDAEAVSA